SPLYPYLHVAGTVIPIWFVFQMGTVPVLFLMAIVALGAMWYRFYARPRIARGGAILHVFARLGEHRYANLDRELRGILKEKGLRVGDPFDDMVLRGDYIEAREGATFE